MAKRKSALDKKAYEEILKLAKEIIRLKKLKKKLGPPRAIRHECTKCHHRWKAWTQEGTCPMCGSVKVNVLF